MSFGSQANPWQEVRVATGRVFIGFF